MADTLLRLGVALVGWLLVFSHGILLAVVPAADCSPDLWQATILFAALGMTGALMLPAGLAWRENLRWLVVPAVVLWAIGSAVSIRLWDGVSGAALCDVLAGVAPTAAGEGWQRAWAPAQLLVTLACGAQGLRYWLPEAGSERSAEHAPQ